MYTFSLRARAVRSMLRRHSDFEILEPKLNLTALTFSSEMSPLTPNGIVDTGRDEDRRFGTATAMMIWFPP